MKIKGINFFLITVWLLAITAFLVITGGHTILICILLGLIFFERFLAQIAIKAMWKLLLEAVQTNRELKDAIK